MKIFILISIFFNLSTLCSEVSVKQKTIPDVCAKILDVHRLNPQQESLLVTKPPS